VEQLYLLLQSSLISLIGLFHKLFIYVGLSRPQLFSIIIIIIIIFPGSAAQRGLWPPVAVQPSAGYGLLWLCSPARAMAFSGSAAQRELWPPVALQPSAGYGLLWLCSPARAMASCGCAAQRGLWPPVALQPSAGYGLLWLCSPARAMASSSTRFLDHTERRATVGRTPLDE
jgi:hypothetical protein